MELLRTGLIKRSIRRGVAVLMSLVLLLALFVFAPANAGGDSPGLMTVGAATESELRAKQAQLEKQQASIKSKLSNLKSSKASTQAQVDQINALIDNLQAQIDTVNADIAAKEAEIAAIEKDIAEKEANIAESQEKFKQRVRSMYISGNFSGGIELLLTAEDFQDFLARMTYVESMADHDQQIIDALNADRSNFMSQRATIEQKKGEIESQKKVLSSKKTELDAQKAQADALLAQLASDEADLQAEQAKIDKEMAGARAALDALIRKATEDSKGSTYAGGAFKWPAPGYNRISSPFGWRAWSNSYHKGIDIAAPIGAAIVAANAGTVITSSFDANGYGNYVVIDHGGGYLTVYGHLSRKSVSVGQQVARGGTIGLCGSTGRSSGPHLHFEIRYNSVAYNPMQYLG